MTKTETGGKEREGNREEQGGRSTEEQGWRTDRENRILVRHQNKVAPQADWKKIFTEMTEASIKLTRQVFFKTNQVCNKTKQKRRPGQKKRLFDRNVLICDGHVTIPYGSGILKTDQLFINDATVTYNAADGCNHRRLSR